MFHFYSFYNLGIVYWVQDITTYDEGPLWSNENMYSSGPALFAYFTFIGR